MRIGPKELVVITSAKINALSGPIVKGKHVSAACTVVIPPRDD